MPKLTPVSWNELVTKLRKLGFEGPFSGGKHPQMRRGDFTLIIPNPHKNEISVGSQLIQNQEKSANNFDKLRYSFERLKKSKAKKLNSLQSFISSVFQFKGGIYDLERDKIIAELQKNKYIEIDVHNKVHYL